MSAILTLDDTDPSIVYSLGWGREGSKLEYNSTTSFTRAAGTSARVTFQGTSIGVYGTVAARDRLLLPPVTSYIIDGGAPVTFTATPAAKAEYSQLFFQSPVLPSGQHTLVITHALASASFFLDFMQVTMDTVPTIPSSSSSALSSASSTSVLSSTTSLISSTTSSLSSTTILSTPSPTPIFTTSSSTIFSTTSSIDAKSSDSAKDENVGSTSATKSSNAGAIAGGIIGAIIALALIVFVVIFYRRKQERRRRNEYLDYKSDGHVWTPGAAAAAASSSASIEPFANTQSSPAAPPVRIQQTMSQASLPQTQSYGYAQPRYPGGYAPSPTTTGNPNMYNNPAYASPAPAQSAYTFAPSEEEDPYGGYETRNAYGQGQTQGYPAGAYLSPSQLMNAYNNDYGRGMPNRPY